MKKSTVRHSMESMQEDVRKRTADSRYFKDKDNAGKFYILKALSPINYYKNGSWQVIDTRLKRNNDGTYIASNQEEPVGFDINKQASFIIIKNQAIYFNKWKLYGDQNGSLTLLATADWHRFTAGEDGLHINEIFPGIDAEMMVTRGSIKTNFIVRKNSFQQYDKLVFKDEFKNISNNGSFSTQSLLHESTAAEFASGSSRLTVQPAFMYSQNDPKSSFSPIAFSANKNELSFAINTGYLTKYLLEGAVIIDPIVSSLSSLAVASITGSRNCGSQTLTCDYALSATTPAKATVTDIYWQFGFFAEEDMTEGSFSIESGTCTTGYYSVVDPANNHKPGTVSSQGDWVQATELLPCLPPPSCTPQAMSFKLRFYNTNCSGLSVCSDAFVKASEPLQILIEGYTLEQGSISATEDTVCAGTATTLTAVGNYGVPPYSYSWNSGAGTNGTATVSPNSTTTYKVTTTDQCSTTASGSITIVVNPIPVIGTTTSNSPICEGATLQINTTPIAGATFSWTGPNGFTSTNTTNAILNATTAASGIYTVTATKNSCPSIPVNVTATVDAIAAPSVTISASASVICKGTSITFTATPANAGAAPIYQWKINGINAGTNANTFTSSTLSNNDTVSCVVTSSAVCSTTPTAISNFIGITVNELVTPTVSISASNSNICAGIAVTFTATAANGGNAPIYQWKLNGANVGTNSNQYSNSNLSNSDIVLCEIIGNADCSTTPNAISNSIKMTVNPLITPTIKITASDTAVCINTDVNFTATITNGGSQPAYQWKLNGNNVGISANTYSINSLADNDQISCQLTTSIGCPSSPTILSNIITMDVSVPVTPIVVINTADTNVCLGVNTTFTANATNGGPSPIYQWKLNGNNVGTNNATYSNATLKTGDKISVVITSNATCATAPTATSNVLTIKVNTVVAPTITITASPMEICSGAPVNFIATTTDEGNSPVFDWLINGLTTNGDSKNFTANNLSDGDSVVAILFPQGIGCLATSTVISNAIAIKVNATPVVNAGNDTMIFRGTGFRLNGQATGNISSYEWTPPIYLSSTSIRNPTTFPLTTITYTLKATSNADCSSSDTVRIKVLTRIEAPNAFSPNGDGINDSWNIVGLVDYEGATLEIFDRYGQPVLKTTGYSKPWDGTRNGKPFPVATYYYIITPQNGLQPITGSVTIIK